MAVANSVPRFIASPIVGVAAISAANANRDGTGTVVTVVTAGVTGTIIDLIRAVATGTTTLGMVRLFIHDGANYRLYAEIPVSAITPSASLPVFEGEYVPRTPLILPSGYSLRASTHNAEGFSVFAIGGDY
jgi:hypothetical protein